MQQNSHRNGNTELINKLKRLNLGRLLRGLCSSQCSFQGQSQHVCYSREAWRLWPAVGVAAVEFWCFPSNNNNKKQTLITNWINIINWIQSTERVITFIFRLVKLSNIFRPSLLLINYFISVLDFLKKFLTQLYF